MYEIFEKLLELKGITIYKFCKENEISESTIYTWKRKKSVAKHELAEKVCEYFGVTIDFLMGKEDEITCPICRHTYHPLDDFDVAIHDMYHEKFIHAKEVFPFFIDDRFGAKIIGDSELMKFMDSSLEDEERLNALKRYLEANFSSNIGYYDLEIDMNTYTDFCKSEIIELLKEEPVREELVDKICKLYDIDKTYLDEADIIFAKANKNPQFIRILKYAEQLNPEMLNAIEIQLKALAEQSNKEQPSYNDDTEEKYV